MAKINSKIDEVLRKDVIENGVFLGTILIFGFNDNIYLYENEVYVEQFKLTDDDYVVTDFYQGSWEVINTNINSGKFNVNEPYAEALIDYMNLYNRSLYLSNKKYREIAKEQFAELKKEYEESGLLDDINALLKKSKSKTFRYSKYESKKNVGESLKESVDKTFFDFMCDKDFFKGISKQVTKKEKCQFDFYKTPNSYTWLITYKEGESLSINMDERTNDIFIHVTKNGKSGKDFKFPQLTFNDSVDELLDIIIRYVQGTFDSSWYESKKSARKSIKESVKSLKEYNYDAHNKSWVSDSAEKVYTNGLEYKNDWCILSLYKDEYENLVNYLLDEKGFILEKKYTKKLGYDVFINKKLDLYVVIMRETTYGFFDEKHFIIRFGDELEIETPIEVVEKTLKSVLFETFDLTKNDVDLIKSNVDYIMLKTKEPIDKKLLDDALNDELSKYHYPISVEVEEGKDELICIIWVF